MSTANTSHWTASIKLIHWLTALTVIGLCIVGWWMDGLPRGPDKIRVYALHKSFGLTVLALSLLRVLIRLRAKAPPLPAGTPRWQALVAHATHGLLYLILFAMPLSGWLFNSAAGFPLRWFDLFKVPALSGADPDLKSFAQLAHLSIFWVLAVVFTLHLGAALKHHLIDRDDILIRMLPRRKSKGT